MKHLEMIEKASLLIKSGLVQMDSDFKLEIQGLLIIKRDVHGAIEIGNVEEIDKHRENHDRDEGEE